MKLDWFVVARDVILVLLIGFAGQLIVGAVTGDPKAYGLTLAFPVMCAGFLLSGWLTRLGRARHLGAVALGVWIVGIALRALEGDKALNVPVIVVAALAIAPAALVGGLIASVLARPPQAGPPSEA